jgi:hypothetical protein
LVVSGWWLVVAGSYCLFHERPPSVVRHERPSPDETVAVTASVAKTAVKSTISVKGSRVKRVPSVVM